MAPMSYLSVCNVVLVLPPFWGSEFCTSMGSDRAAGGLRACSNNSQVLSMLWGLALFLIMFFTKLTNLGFFLGMFSCSWIVSSMFLTSESRSVFSCRIFRRLAIHAFCLFSPLFPRIFGNYIKSKLYWQQNQWNK